MFRRRGARGSRGVLLFGRHSTGLYGESVEEVAGRLLKVKGAFENLRTMWRSREISVKTKLLLYCSIVESTILYGCEW